MQSERIYLVRVHPRYDSLTAHIAGVIHQWAMERKIQVTELDLHRRNFNPVMTPEDEPDWKNMDKRYPPEVHQLYSELLEHDTLVVILLPWWYSFPVILKGYIDRIWNNGLAYGDGYRLLLNRVHWVALAGGDEESFIQMDWEKDINDHLRNVCNYPGIEDADVTFLCNTVVLDGEEFYVDYYQSLLSQVQGMVNAL